MSIKRKLTAIAAAAVMSITGLSSSSVSAEEQDIVRLQWIPGDFNDARDLLHQHGLTYVDDSGRIYIIRKEDTRISDIEYILDYKESMTDTLLYHNIYTGDKSGYDFNIELWVYKPQRSSSSEFLLLSAGGITGAVSTDAVITFETDKDGKVTETDILSWLPDSQEEFYLFKKYNPVLSVHDNKMVLCDVLEPYTTLNLTQEGEGRFKEVRTIHKRDFDDAEIWTYDPVPDSYIKLYEPEKAGDVTLTFKAVDERYEQQKNGDSLDRDIARRSIKINDDLTLSESFDDLPKNAAEFRKYLESHEKAELKDGYIIYCDDICEDGGCELSEEFTSPDNSLHLECVFKNRFGNGNPMAVGGSMHYVRVYKAELNEGFTSGSGTAAWTEAQPWNAESKRIISKKINISGGKTSFVKNSGDADCDGEITLNDTAMLKKYLIKKGKIGCFDNADCSGDGKVNVIDFLMLKNELAGKADNEFVQAEKNENGTAELTAGLKPVSIESKKPDSSFSDSQADFAVSLLKNTLLENNNTLVSPYSAVQALAMTDVSSMRIAKK